MSSMSSVFETAINTGPFIDALYSSAREIRPEIIESSTVSVPQEIRVIKNIGKIVVDVITEKVENGTYENLEAKVELRNRIERYVARETGKRPMIIPAIIEINV